ncbi:HHL1-like protein [Pseudanabaena minima]|uniref:HHL1-like protein n=1 Tax=Pseudanabaena minima TaxID=890415 RepID=UPI003DAA4A1E
MSVTKPTGFAQGTGQSKKKKKAPNKHQVAASKYDEMKDKGLPEFNIFIRIKGKEWVPAGSMAVERSNLISRAIFQQEAELLKGAIRLYPILRKFKDNLEYGYRLKEFPDEEITVAVLPEPTIGDKFQYAFTKAKEYFNSVTKKNQGK